MDQFPISDPPTQGIARLLATVESERRHTEELLQALPVAVAIADSGLNILSANRAFRRLFGLPRHGPLELTLPEIPGLGDTADLARRALDGDLPLTRTLPSVNTAAGLRTLKLSLQSAAAWDDPDSRELIALVEEPVIAPGALPVIHWRVDLASQRFTLVEGAATFTCPLPQDLWAEGASFFSARILAEDLPRVQSYYHSAVSGSRLRAVDYRARSLAGEARWLRDVFAVEWDSGGAPIALNGITVDLAQSRRRDDATAQSDKVAALARVASLIAHDCNNLLMILGGYGEELLYGIDADNPLRSNVQEILYAGDRLGALTFRLSSFVQHRAPSMSVLNVDAWLGELHWKIRQQVPREIELVFQLKCPDVSVSADPELLGNVIETLTGRAAEAMARGGVISVSTRPFHLLEATTDPGAVLPAGPYVEIIVHDDGLAMHPEVMRRVFEPDLSSETQVLKLAPLYHSIREMGGDLTVTSDYQNGTTFTILLPQSSPAALDSSEPPPATALPPAPPDPPNILVVEDEGRIRSLISKVLSRAGFRVHEASEARQAMETVKSLPDRLDLLITDVVLPEVSGVELAGDLRQLRPALPVLFISGYPGAPGASGSKLPPGSRFLQKPFTIPALMNMIREALPGSSAAAD